MTTEQLSRQETLHPLRDFLRFAGNVLAALWIFGGMAFFFIRFSTIFYYANKPAVDALMARWRQ